MVSVCIIDNDLESQYAAGYTIEQVSQVCHVVCFDDGPRFLNFIRTLAIRDFLTFCF